MHHRAQADRCAGPSAGGSAFSLPTRHRSKHEQKLCRGTEEYIMKHLGLGDLLYV